MIHGLLLALLLVGSPQTGAYKVSGTVVRDDKQDPATAPQANQIRISGPSTQILTIGAGGTFEFPAVRPGTLREAGRRERQPDRLAPGIGRDRSRG